MTLKDLVNEEVVLVSLMATFCLGLALEIDALRLDFKALPILLMSLRAFLNHQRSIACGLFLGALGDIALELSRQAHGDDVRNEQWFMAGLVLFAVGHFYFIYAYLTHATWAVVRERWHVFALAWLSAVLFFAFFIAFGDIEPKMIAPVLVYALVIMSFAGSAFLADDHNAIVGALVFISSDFQLAFDRFVNEVPHIIWTVMITYYLSQYFTSRALQATTSNKKRD